MFLILWKKKIVKIFHDKTSSEALATFPCASCSSLTLNIEHKIISSSDINIDLLKPYCNLPSQMPMLCRKWTPYTSCVCWNYASVPCLFLMFFFFLSYLLPWLFSRSKLHNQVCFLSWCLYLHSFLLLSLTLIIT